MNHKKPEKCAVINCGKILSEGNYATIGEKKYCKECAVLIAQEEIRLLSNPYTSLVTQKRTENTR
ncbi:MAG: hypothetical protein ACUVXA_03265 [Candidatus Jordarchaeum sp.]|uniref:hypothetical protein n=1 Tax=Candidatus Jordarchaeum sp. TaxID=2823881 RepID=UPI004049D09D